MGLALLVGSAVTLMGAALVRRHLRDDREPSPVAEPAPVPAS
jgi:hypothetical protein